MSEENVIAEIKRDYMVNLLSKGKRIDGRRPDEFRDITVIPNPIATAEGSARVKLGGTDVVVGIKIALGDPYPDSKDKGVMTTMAELVPLASPLFESGPPSPMSIEISRVVDRGIRESGSIDLRALKVPGEEKVFIVFIDIYPMDMDGNLIDASTIAAMSALFNTIVPASILTAELENPMEDFKLPIKHCPIAITGVKIGETMVLDPSQEEEDIAGARLTVTTIENGDLCAMQKGNIGRLSIEDIDYIVENSVSNGREIRKILMNEASHPALVDNITVEKVESTDNIKNT